MNEPAGQGGKQGYRPSRLRAGTEGNSTATLVCDNLREDHRKIEGYLDRLLAVFKNLSVERIPEIQSIVSGIQQLSAVHFEKEEKILYPRLRSIQPQLLDQMDSQHEVVREVETHVAGMLADPPREPEPRWLNELRCFGTEFHDHIQHHILDEEDHLFRVAEDHLTIEEQANLGEEMAAVQKRMAQDENP